MRLRHLLLLLLVLPLSARAQDAPFRGEEHRIKRLELRGARMVDAIRLIAEISGLNVVSTEEAGKATVTLYAEDQSVWTSGTTDADGIVALMPEPDGPMTLALKAVKVDYLAAVDDVKRFSSSRKLVRYSGLCPTVRSSGERTEYGSISREGRSDLRAVWIQIAHLVAADRSRSTVRLRRWYQKVLRQRGKKTAVVALARKLLTIAYRLLYDETDYRSRLVSQKAA